jgi:hypothetical protein
MVPPDKLQRPFGPAGDGNNIIEHLAGQMANLQVPA